MDTTSSPANEESPLVTSGAENGIATPPESSPWQRRLRDSSDLPQAVRQQIESLLPAASATEATIDEPTLSLGRVLDLLEGVIPLSMRLAAGEATIAEHPSGEAFFTSEKELTDADAERLAREQLQRCGLLRK